MTVYLAGTEMFLHIVAVDKQLSVHIEGGEPLSKAIARAFKFHGVRQSGKHRAKNAAGKVLATERTPKALGLKDEDMVYVS